MTTSGRIPADTGLPATWSAVVINWNDAADLPDCIASLMAQDWPPHEVVVVDNASRDTSLEVIAGLSSGVVRLLANPENRGFAGAANQGIAATRGDLVATFNPDVTLAPDWASRLRVEFTDARIGAAGGKLLFTESGSIQHAGGVIDRMTMVATNLGRGETDSGQFDRVSDVDFLTGAAVMLRRSALDQIGAFDEAFFPAYYEDVDLCERLRQAGWRVRHSSTATGKHRESASVDAASNEYFRMIHAGRLRFAAKHLSLTELVGTFLPREAARLGEALLHLDAGTSADRTGATVYPASLLASPIDGLPSAQGAPMTAAEADLTDDQTLRGDLAALGQHWLVREQPFASAAPLLGSVIVWGRRFMNDLAPRWHVLAILAQQIEFNAAAYRAARSTAAETLGARLLAEGSTRVLAERLEQLAADQTELAARLTRLEIRLREIRPPENP